MNARRGLQMILAAVMFAAIVPMVSAEIADHVVISEIYPNAFGASESDSEWVELYNPTNSPVDVSGWTINSSSGSSGADATIPSGKTISAYGFYLVADDGFSTGKDNSSWPNADFEDNINLNNNNGWVCLENLSGDVVDTVGWGSSATVYEGLPYLSNPNENKSIERKANETGAIPGYGNAWDTDNNSNDFVLRDDPNPRNSSSSLQPLPELSTLILISIGLILLVCITSFKRLKNE